MPSPCLPPLPPGVWLRRPIEDLPWPLSVPGARVFANARQALAAGVRTTGLVAGDELLVPALLDAASVEALLAAGLVPRPYDLGADLDPLVSPGTRAVVITHTLGFPQDPAGWRRWADERGVLLIEDASHAWPGQAVEGPLGSFGAVGLLGIGAAYGLPVGVALRADGEPSGEIAPRGRAGAFDRLLRRLAGEDPAAARRSNYALLLGELGDRVAEGFGELPDGASPWAFPVHGERGAGVFEPHASVDLSRYPRAAELSRAAVLPVHQGLRADDIERVIASVSAAPRPAPPVLEPVERLEDLAADFDRLAEASRNLFATWDWIERWWDHFGAEGRLRLFAVRDASRDVVGIVPLYLARERPVGILRFLGHGSGDRLGPISAPEHAPLVARAFGRALRDGSLGGELVLAEQLPGEERWPALLGAAVVAREGSPVLHVPGSFDEWLAGRSRNFREQVRRRERKLGREHELAYRLTQDEGELEADLETLFRLHDARWTEGESDSFTPERRAFHLDFARTALRRGRLRLWTLTLDGQPAAAWLGYRYAGAEWYYQAGRDPAFERQAVGFVLMSHTVREALADGVHEYRLLRGGEEYKARFSTSDPGLETAIIGRGPGGRLGAAAVLAAAGLPDDLRRRVRSVTG